MFFCSCSLLSMRCLSNTYWKKPESRKLLKRIVAEMRELLKRPVVEMRELLRETVDFVPKLLYDKKID